MLLRSEAYGNGGLQEFVGHACKISARESPVEGRGHTFVVVLEMQEPLFDFFQAREIVGRQRLAFDDGEVDFDLVEPTGGKGKRARLDLHGKLALPKRRQLTRFRVHTRPAARPGVSPNARHLLPLRVKPLVTERLAQFLIELSAAEMDDAFPFQK